MASFALGSPQPVSDTATTLVADCVHATPLYGDDYVHLESPMAAVNSRHFTSDESIFGPDKVNASVVDGNPNTKPDDLRVPGAHGRPNILRSSPVASGRLRSTSLDQRVPDGGRIGPCAAHVSRDLNYCPPKPH